MPDLSPEQKQQAKNYYLQDEIIQEMVRLAKYREFAPTYPRGYGRRPDAVNYPSDFKSFVKKGAIAFHGSVELWRNPLLIGKTDHDKLRSGWDLVIDIDADHGLDFAKHATLLLIDELKQHGINSSNISAKFSGNRGFHLGIRNESFPTKIGGTKTARLYPKLPQAIVGYLRHRIQDRLAEQILQTDHGLEQELEEHGPFHIADVENDWGQRHLFRMPYSINEKSWLVSLPLNLDDIADFQKPDAQLDKVTVDHSFLDSYTENQAADLAVEALDWLSRQQAHQETEVAKKRKDRDYQIPDEALAENHFPPPIKRIMAGLEDGRKRALFILATFLRHVGYDWDAVEKEIWDWNDRNKEPLRDNYIKSQLQWHRNQNEPLMPPNFDAKGWYHDIGVLDEQEDKQMLDNFDNPVPYANVLKAKAENHGDEDE